MRQVINKRPLRRFPAILMSSTSNEKIKHVLVALSLAFAIIITLSICLAGIVLAQELEYPDPISPKDNVTVESVSSVLFQWKPFGYGTNNYDFELSKNIDMSDPIVQTTINGVTTYQYTGTLDYDTTYWWRVIASEPPGGYWSPVSSFKTPAAPAPIDDTTETETPSDSFISSIISYLEDIGWTMIGLIGGAIVIVIIAVIVLLKPKSKPPAQRQWMGPQPPPRMQQPLICPSCGFPNNPQRQFCNNCGSNLISRGPQSTWGMSQQPPNCPTCGLPTTKGTKFCSNCGTGLAAKEIQQSWTSQPSSPTTCNICGTPLQPGQKFCGNCGAGVTGGDQQQSWQLHQTFTCPICGAPINKGINPCPNCRTWLDW